jgi:hypothetical protein
MKRLAFFVVVLGLSLFSARSHAQTTGIDLQHDCQLMLATNRTADDSIHAAHCLGFINGVGYSIKMWEGYVKQKQLDRKDVPACLPENGTGEEFVKVVLHYLDEHPNRLHESYGLVVVFALHDAYPCTAK